MSFLLAWRMFDFQKLNVYQKSKAQHKQVTHLIKENSLIYRFTKDQLYRASSSIILNIAEGSGKFSKRDKRNFYIIARGSVYECVSILEVLLDEKIISKNEYDIFESAYEEISKMLLGLIRSQND